MGRGVAGLAQEGVVVDGAELDALFRCLGTCLRASLLLSLLPGSP